MKIEVVTGISTFEATKNAFKRIDKTDIDTSYFIVVPDRFTLQAEKLLFDTLEIQSTFNLSVISLTGLAEKVLSSKKINLTSLTALEGILGIKKIVESKQKELNFYKKCTPEFCYEILKNIMQIKSSALKPEDLNVQINNKTLQAKFHDLKIIYQSYEQMFKEKVDSSDILEIFNENTKDSILLKNSIVMFAGFDSFTTESLNLLRCLLSVVKKVIISLPTFNSLKNKYIYEDDILNKLKNIAKQTNVEIEVISPLIELNKNQLQIANNLFAQEKETTPSNFLHVSSSPSIKEEVQYAADLIKYKVFKGERYRDFSVALSSLSNYESIIEEVFTEREIPYYIDSSKNISNSILVNFILKILYLKKKNYLNEDLLYIVSSPLFEVDNKANLIAFINEKGVFGKQGVCKYLSNDLKEILEICSSLESLNTTKDYSNVVRNIMLYVESGYLKYLDKLEENGLLKEKSLEKQTPDVIDKILKIFEDRDDKISFDDFLSLLNLSFSVTELSSLPSFADAVFVGDMTSSYFRQTKDYFIKRKNRASKT